MVSDTADAVAELSVSPTIPVKRKPSSGASPKASQLTSSSSKLTQLRTESFPIKAHNHGKQLVRVLKVDRSAHPHHKIYEYSVATTLHSFSRYSKVYTEENNAELVATDTQKNTVYYVAKVSKADSPEQFAIDLCKHLMKEYGHLLDGVEAEVQGVMWDRHVDKESDESHGHGFTKNGMEKMSATCKFMKNDVSSQTGDDCSMTLSSRIKGMTILKTTQSGFDNYLSDKFTLLPPCSERCLSTELTASWTYTSEAGLFEGSYDFTSSRTKIRERIMHGIFGPAKSGVFSASLQATIYDAACLVLTVCPEVAEIKLDTPNKHYLPFHQLNILGSDTVKFEDDVFVPTDEPSGTISCTVGR
jgi:urate oxidase